MIEAGEPDLFAVLGLPRRYEVDLEDLERRFHERSRLLHPDRFARATPRERRLSLERTTRLNQAYRTLRDPCSRAEYLLSLLDPRAGAGRPAELPPSEAGQDFLEAQLAIREALAAARARRDATAIAAIRQEARDAVRKVAGELAGHLGADAPGPDALAAARSAVARARFHQAVIASAEGTPHARRTR